MDHFPPRLAILQTTEKQKKRQEELRNYRAVVAKQIEDAKDNLGFGKYSCILRLDMGKSFRYELIRELQHTLFPGIEVEAKYYDAKEGYCDAWTEFSAVSSIDDSEFERIRITFSA